ncbi:drug/metabolite transporter (DMT)-like permease [Methanohalophilus levihalophilus]|uniref:DMT family transporter n=1 Tax=Methanohalophilus levihalophilus TaxID=1431282 RepID=UPI001AE2E174|nr:DMT family transporter [Methanohalophilus levihalophilus]MBP2030897.1 drug/metabolite transporter (DMT)-like permease [Methanohalophilus levihalophilus]
MDVQELRKLELKRKVNKGYMWAFFCAVLWGLWYIPGTIIWALPPFDSMWVNIDASNGASAATVVTALLISAFNALTVILALLVWNGVLGKFGEMKRTLKAFHPCSKWFFAASIFGGPIAILGSFIAIGFVGPAFGAVAALLYPVTGSILAYLWYGEKITKRAAVGIFVIMIGGITIFVGGALTELSAGSIAWVGYIGGLMAAVGWGVEGAIAGKGLDIAEPDVGITLRFLGENLIYWVILIPIVVVAMGIPMFSYAIEALNPMAILVLAFAGITFGFCYVSWYKSFPLIGVGRGQGVANLYGLCAVIFIYLFFGSVPEWTIWVGAALCITGSFIMFFEEAGEIESLRGD